MSRTARYVCLFLAFVIVLSLPFLLPSGALLLTERNRLDEEIFAEDDFFSRLLLPSALAEEASISPLPIDFSPGRLPNPNAYAANGYEDESITLRLETREAEGVTWRLAFVEISDPSQLRTALAGSIGSSRVAMISSMALKNNAIIAINANYMSNDPAKTSFEYRMGEKVRAKLNKAKDLLITDENGDFHLFVKSDRDEVKAFADSGRKIVNAFTFGPALVKDSALLELDGNYSYNPHGREPRMAIGQLSELNYVLVHAEGRSSSSQGVTHQELADFMYEIGCRQAFNLDGGNSATMVFNGGYYQQKTSGNERAQSDMIYFASLSGEAGN